MRIGLRRREAAALHLHRSGLDLALLLAVQYREADRLGLVDAKERLLLGDPKVKRRAELGGLCEQRDDRLEAGGAIDGAKGADGVELDAEARHYLAEEQWLHAHAVVGKADHAVLREPAQVASEHGLEVRVEPGGVEAGAQLVVTRVLGGLHADEEEGGLKPHEARRDVGHESAGCCDLSVEVRHQRLALVHVRLNRLRPSQHPLVPGGQKGAA